jgi:hypothetical protein
MRRGRIASVKSGAAESITVSAGARGARLGRAIVGPDEGGAEGIAAYPRAVVPACSGMCRTTGATGEGSSAGGRSGAVGGPDGMATFAPALDAESNSPHITQAGVPMEL